MESCAGVVPLTGNEILMRPENATGLTAEISSCASPAITDHADSSSTNVNRPLASVRLVIVSVTGAGSGR